MAWFIRLFAPRNLTHGIVVFVIWTGLFACAYLVVLTAYNLRDTAPTHIHLLAGATVCAPFLTIALVIMRHQLLLQHKLEHSSTTDSLTGLPNRRAFMADAAQSAKRPGAIVMMLDIDHFKQVNDSYGHEKGDVCLKKVAKRLQASIRPHDIVARMGGEEFALVLVDASNAIAQLVAKRLCAGVSLDTPFGAQQVTLSAGAVRTDGIKSLDDLLRQADEALYQAKDNGRAQLVMAPSMANADQVA